VSVIGLYVTENGQLNAATAVNKWRIKICFCFLGRHKSSIKKYEHLTAM